MDTLTTHLIFDLVVLVLVGLTWVGIHKTWTKK